MSEITAVTLGLNRKPNYFNAKYKIFLVNTFNPYTTILPIIPTNIVLGGTRPHSSPL